MRDIVVGPLEPDRTRQTLDKTSAATAGTPPRRSQAATRLLAWPVWLWR